MYKAVLIRAEKQAKQTLGSFHLFNGANEVYKAVTMELPYRKNRVNFSCIPTGIYKVKIAKSPRYGLAFHLQNVQNRTHILIHAGNYNRDTKGCILLGANFKDIDRDGLKDVTSSRVMVRELIKIADEFTLTIVEI